jgi:hypothetical protein
MFGSPHPSDPRAKWTKGKCTAIPAIDETETILMVPSK